MEEVEEESIFEDENVLVTGGAGFIGANLIRTLYDLGANIIVLDDFSAGRRENIRELEDKIRLIESDLSLISSPLPGFEDIQYVFHLAAQSSVARSMEDPIHTNRANVTATLRLLEICRQIEPRMVVFASSCATYGNQPELPLREDMDPLPNSPYAASKRAMEVYANAYYRQFELPIISLRLFNIYGPYQRAMKDNAPVVPSFISSILDRQQPIIYGDGEQTRDFTYVDAAVDGFIQAAKKPKYSGNIYNISSYQTSTVNRVFELLRELIGMDLEPEYRKERPGDIKHSYADITRAREDLDFDPDTPLEEGLQKTVEWFRAAHERKT